MKSYWVICFEGHYPVSDYQVDAYDESLAEEVAKARAIEEGFQPTSCAVLAVES